MIRNYFRIAIRNLRRHKLYSFINVFGLTIGLTGSCLLLLFLKNELSYDTFHEKADRIARVIEVDHESDEMRYYGRTSALTGPTLVEEYSGVANQTRLTQPMGHIDIHWKGERISEREWFIADSTFFEIFNFEFIEGDANTALDEPNSIVLTESTARKYYGDRSPIGEVMPFLRISPMKVTGVIKDVPANSHLQFDVVLSRNTGFEQFSWWQRGMNSWDIFFTVTYIELSSSDALHTINNKADEFVAKHRKDGEFYLQPLTDIYLNSENIEFAGTERAGDWMTIYLFGAIAAFLLIIACINYVNLATSKSMERAKEIGIRKVSGAVRFQLIYQFLSEAMIISFVAFLLSLISVDVLMPYFNELSGVEISATLFSAEIIGLLLLLSITVGLISGSYPAFYLSQLKPSQSLRGSFHSTGKGVFLRKILVITQFTLSIFMIVATIVVSQQMDYMQNKKLGFDSEHLMVIDINNGNVRQSFEAMKNEFSELTEVKNVSSLSRVPGDWKNINEVFIKPGENASDSIQSYFMAFDAESISTLDLEIAEGRNFTGNLAQDSTAVLLNQTAAAQLGDDIIGKQVYLPGVSYPLKVVGVIKDFNFQSLHQEVAPLVMGYWYNPVTVIDYFALRLNKEADITKAIESARMVHQKFDDSTQMEFHFLDQQLDLFYQAEQRAGSIFTIGAGLTVLIACLGLFGLASFIVQKRTKEIGVRKVLGASVSDLFFLLSKTFALQVVVAFLIATPFAWYFMDSWLDNFAFRFEMGVIEYVVAGVVALAVALLSVSYRVIKAALLNPAETLKNE